MAGVRCTDVQTRPTAFLEMTSLTLKEWQPLVPPCEAAFQAPRAAWRLDGTPRTARRLSVYQHGPWPTPEDRLLFIPTVCLEVMSLMTRGCGYNWLESEPRVAQEFPGACGNTERARDTCTTPLSAVRSARRLMREGHGGCPRGVAPRRRHTARRVPRGGVHGRSNAPSASPSVRGDVRSPILFSPLGPGLVARDTRRKLLI